MAISQRTPTNIRLTPLSFDLSTFHAPPSAYRETSLREDLQRLPKLIWCLWFHGRHRVIVPLAAWGNTAFCLRCDKDWFQKEKI